MQRLGDKARKAVTQRTQTPTIIVHLKVCEGRLSVLASGLHVIPPAASKTHWRSLTPYRDHPELTLKLEDSGWPRTSYNLWGRLLWVTPQNQSSSPIQSHAEAKFDYLSYLAESQFSSFISFMQILLQNPITLNRAGALPWGSMNADMLHCLTFRSCSGSSGDGSIVVLEPLTGCYWGAHARTGE